jgi:hypothetical protein
LSIVGTPDESWKEIDRARNCSLRPAGCARQGAPYPNDYRSLRAVSTFGSLHAAFNNAGVMTPASETADAGGDDVDRVHTVNLRGVWNRMSYEPRQLREQGSGAIVNCSSIGGLIGNLGRAIYGAAKHGVIGRRDDHVPCPRPTAVSAGGR